MRLYLWKVTYSSTFLSSSGMEKYTNKYPETTQWVVTLDATIDAVLSVLGHEAGPWGDTKIQIKSAEFLGDVQYQFVIERFDQKDSP